MCPLSWNKGFYPQPSIKHLDHLMHKCTKDRSLTCALYLYAYLCRYGLHAHSLLGNYLVSMLVDAGSVFTARKVFDMLVCRNECAGNSLIHGYISCGELKQALKLYREMQQVSLCPNGYTYVLLLKACAKLKDIEQCSQIHMEVSDKGLLRMDPFIGSTLVDTYAKCGLLTKAQEVFHNLVDRNVVTWNALIAGHVQHGCDIEVLFLLERMQLECVLPDAITLTCSVKVCSSMKSMHMGNKLHAEIATLGLLKTDPFVGSALIDMYSECGSIAKARGVFDLLSARDVVTWNALIAGLVQNKHGEEALHLFEQMQLYGVSPNTVTFACILKACGNIGAMDRGIQLHGEIAKKGLLKEDTFVGNMLVVMYTKFGMFAKALEVFDMLPVRNKVTWTTLIEAYLQHDQNEKALVCLRQMQLEGSTPDAVTFACCLKACGSIGRLEEGLEIHAEIERKLLLKTEPFVGCALVDMYAKCGSLLKAQEISDILPVRDTATWNTLIAGYVMHVRNEEALSIYKQMQLEGVFPDAITFTYLLEACANIQDEDRGSEVHAEIARKSDLQEDVFLGSALIDMYGKCGSLAKAQEVFDRLSVLDIVTWNAIIAVYIQHECSEEAVECFELMQLAGVSPDAITLTCIVKACGCIGAAEKGSECHAEIVRKGLLESDSSLGIALVNMYGMFGSLAQSQEVFDKLPVRSVVTWNALIAGYVQHKHGVEGLSCLKQMQLEGVQPNVTTYTCSLKACGISRNVEKGIELHAEIARKELLNMDTFVGIALVDMYAKCGMLTQAQDVFDTLPTRNVVTWTALIAGYVQQELGEEAFNCYKQMQMDCVSSDVLSLACGLKACCSIEALEMAGEIHEEIVNKGLLRSNILIGKLLIDLYGKHGMLRKMQEVFDLLLDRDVVTWTALIEGYVQHHCGEEAIHCMGQMFVEGVTPNALTLAFTLKACGSAGSITKGSEIHSEIARMGLLKEYVFLGNALIDMYVKCGLLGKSQEVFDHLLTRNIFTWNSLITGYAQSGDLENVFHLFNKMSGEGIEPDEVTFVSILNACSHSGALEESQIYLDAMSENYGIIPTINHHTCFVDLLGRAGQIERAVQMMKETPFHPDNVMLLAVLGSCRKWGHVELARQSFEQAEQWVKDSAAYICMYNIYADAQMVEGCKMEVKCTMHSN